MARKTIPKLAAATKRVEQRSYTIDEAIPLVKKSKSKLFDETVVVHMRLGIDPKHANQMVRGTIVLPNGLGKSVRVLVIAKGDRLREATEAGADFVGGEEIVAKILDNGWTDYDAVIATPDMMRSVAKLVKVLGPLGLMPDSKSGTVTTNVTQAIREAKASKVEFRVDNAGVIHAPVGKVSLKTDKLLENAKALIGAVVRAKPAAAQGKYVESVTVSSTMGPGILVGLPVNSTGADGSTMIGWGPSFIPMPPNVSPGNGQLDPETAGRYHRLQTLRRTGKAASADLIELKRLSESIANEPPPAEYASALSALSGDRLALKESMARIENLLNRIAGR